MMKKTISITIILLLAIYSTAGARQKPGLKDALGKYFLVGCAMNTEQINGNDEKSVELAKANFNSIVAENCMKPENIEPEEGKYNWTDADKLVNFGHNNNMKVIGHVLVWHSQTAPWMFQNKYGELPNREEMIKRRHGYIVTVVNRYKGRVFGWDVANECFLDDGSFRQSPWYRAIGPEFIKLAFQFAHEADPDAELYYNDYSMSNPGKRAAVIKLIKDLKASGCRIDAVGMQSHNGTDYPDLKEYEETMKALIGAGVKINISGLDVNMLPNPESFSGADISQKYAGDPKMNPYVNGLPKQAEQLFKERYMSFFRLYYKYREHIARVCTWGITDNSSWLNDWPIKGRTNYPLLFDRKYKAKPVVEDIIKLFESSGKEQEDKPWNTSLQQLITSVK